MQSHISSPGQLLDATRRKIWALRRIIAEQEACKSRPARNVMHIVAGTRTLISPRLDVCLPGAPPCLCAREVSVDDAEQAVDGTRQP